MVDSRTVTPWPVGIRLFNRPEYTERFLESLVRQSVAIDPSRTICFVDSYPKSSDYFQKIPDRTEEVIALVKRYIPEAHIIHPDINVGLANALFTLQESIYNLPHARWGIFLEDDLVLDTQYLEVLGHFIELADTQEDVVKVSACQIHTGYFANPPAAGRRNFFLGEGTKAMAEQASFFELRRPIIEQYLQTLAGSSYRHRNRSKVFAALASNGIFSVMGNNDGVLDQCVAYYGKLHITFERDLVDDIGVIGESNFVMPKVTVANVGAQTNPLTLTQEDFNATLGLLKTELAEIQNWYFEELWQVYRRADSVQHTIKFILNKTLSRLRQRLSR